MVEKDYILATNKAKITLAIHTINSCFIDKEYGLNKEEIVNTIITLQRAESKLYELCGRK
jgi:hypothetical protein